MALLAQIRGQPGVSTSRLAQLLAIERSTVVRDVQVLERMGLVISEPNPQDRRGRQLALTRQGNQRLAAAAPEWRSSQDLMRARLGSRSMDELVTLAQQLVAHGDAEDR